MKNKGLIVGVMGLGLALGGTAGSQSRHFNPRISQPAANSKIILECVEVTPVATSIPTAIPTQKPTVIPTIIPTVAPTPVPACMRITNPTQGQVINGNVPIMTTDTCTGAWYENLYIDDAIQGSFAVGKVVWNSNTAGNGPHSIKVTSQSQNPGSMVLGTAAVGVTIYNVVATPTPTGTPPAITSIPFCKDAVSCAQFPLSDAQARAFTDQYFANQPFTQEKLPANTGHNSMVPSAAQLAAVTPMTNLQNSDGQRLMKLVTGNCYPGGTTQQIYTCAAIKWGYPPRMFWAEGYNESYWSHSSIGDIGAGVSLGILQVKSSDFTGTCPSVTGCPSHNYTADSDANNYILCPGLNARGVNGPTCLTYQYTNYGAEYAIAWQHACMVGDNTYLASGTGGRDSTGFTFPPYQVGPGKYNDKWGCIGTWFSGQWLFGPGSTEYSFNNNLGYHVFMQHYYCCQPYNYSGFGNGQAGTGLSCNASCQLP